MKIKRILSLLFALLMVVSILAGCSDKAEQQKKFETFEDFENARLVVMARKLRSGEDNTPLNNAAHTNPNPTYPQKWYDERGIKREEE